MTRSTRRAVGIERSLLTAPVPPFCLASFRSKSNTVRNYLIKLIRVIAIFFFVALLAFAGTALAQSAGLSATLIGVDDAAFPLLTLRLSLVNGTGRPVAGLTRESVEVIEDGNPAEVISVADISDTEQGIAVVLVIDVSESMLGEPLAAARQSAESFVESLGPNDQVAILSFATTVQVIQPFTSDKASAIASIGELQAGGVTALYDAANQGVLAAAQSNLARRVVILLGDGAEYGGASLSAADDAYEAARANGVTIHTIALGFNADTTYFQKLSGLTGGLALTAPTPAELDAQWKDLSGLMHQFVEVVVKSNAPGDGQIHSLTVRVKIGGAQAEAAGTFKSKAVPPTVTVSGLTAGETIGDVTPITAMVDAQGGVTGVTFSVDGAVIARRADSPWIAEIDPRTLIAGSHDLGVEAVDETGTAGSISISFQVPPLPPSVSINLQEGQVLDAPLSLTPDTRAQGGVKEVTVAVDGKPVETLTSEPYRFALDPARYSGGAHVLTVTVTDVGGLSASAEAGFSVPRAAGLNVIWIAALAAVALMAIAAVVIAIKRKPAAPPAPVGARLEVLNGPDKGREFAVTGERQVIGRLSSVSICLADPTGALHLSREHARVWQSEGAAFIEDAGSRYGVLVNGEKVSAAVRLADGAQIKLGEVELVFHGAPVAAGDLRATQFNPAALAEIEALAGASSELAPVAEEIESRRTKVKEPESEATIEETPEESEESRWTRRKPEEDESDPPEEEPRRTKRKPES